MFLKMIATLENSEKKLSRKLKKKSERKINKVDSTMPKEEEVRFSIKERRKNHSAGN